MSNERITVRRSDKSGRNRYTPISNITVLQNKSLSWRERGLLSFLLSLPETWTFNKRSLQAFSEEDGRDATVNAFNSLIKKGFIKQFKQDRNKTGVFGSKMYLIMEEPEENPILEEHVPENPDAHLEFSPENPAEDGFLEGEPLPEKPNTDNPPLQSNIRESTQLREDIISSYPTEEVNSTSLRARGEENLPPPPEPENYEHLLPVPTEDLLDTETLSQRMPELLRNPHVVITPGRSVAVQLNSQEWLTMFDAKRMRASDFEKVNNYFNNEVNIRQYMNNPYATRYRKIVNDIVLFLHKKRSKLRQQELDAEEEENERQANMGADPKNL